MTTNSPNPVDGDVQALIMSQKEMQDFANIYRSDNDQGTYAWFDASLANWSEGFLSPKDFEHVFDQESATKWLDREIEIFIEDGRCPRDYVYLKSNPALNPVIVVFYEGKAVIWDGYHRIAAAVHRNMPIYAIFTTAPAQPYASRKQKRNDHSKLAAEIVDNLVSTDSCDEEVTEKLILWVLNRLNKEFPTPPAQLLRPVELPQSFYGVVQSGKAVMLPADDGQWINKTAVIEALRQQGYEVKND